MPFEPRLYADDDRREPQNGAAHHDDVCCPACGAAISVGEAGGAELAGEERLSLPADLVALADQLGDDADHLARRYPAADSKVRHRTAPARRSASGRWIRWSVAAAVIAIIATGPSVGERSTSSVRPDAAAREAIAQIDRGKSGSLVNAATLKATNEWTVANGSGVEPVSIGDERLNQPRHLPADEVEMLRIQVSGFQKVIERLQDELAARDKSQAEMVKLIRSLQDEVATLKAQGARGNGEAGVNEKPAAHATAKTTAPAPK